ncbi:MAG: ABC transporter ATP-binding protein [Synergistaceae bacterium]|jgi:ABC-type branched-subunit amino acid transport system ATPase component|nr:ABC transporter ATP-binding protein [Synergistaceae bacterium]
MMAALLEVRGLTRVFGGIRAVDSLSFDAHEGGITGLIGPNGAGKTTVFNLITGVYRPTAGTVCLAGGRLTGCRPDDVVRAGVARTFQNIRLFARRTCLENVTTPILARASYGPIAAVLRTPSARSAERAAREKAFAIMEELGIERFASFQASNLPYGMQRKLEIARALACSPKVLLLDEPAAGMNDAETHELGETIKRALEDFGVTILLIEHHINLVLDICTHVVVMERGALLAHGTPGDIRENPAVVEAYLGRRRRDRA